MAPIEDTLFKLECLKTKIIKIKSLALEIEENFDSKKSRRLLAISPNINADLHSAEELIAKLNSLYTKSPELKPQGCDLISMLSDIQGDFFDILTVIDLVKSKVGTTSVSTTADVSLDQSSNGLSLPVIKLPIFDGSSLLEWLNFKNLFYAMIEGDSKLNKLQKFIYLKSCLKGEALSIISQLSISDENYELSLRLLGEHYDDKVRLTASYLNCLWDLNPVVREINSLRHFVAKIRELVGALTNIGHVTTNWDVLLVFLLRKKLSRDLMERWESTPKVGTYPTLDEFLDFLLAESKVVDKIGSNPRQMPNNSKPLKLNKPSHYQGTNIPSPISLNITTNENKIVCLMCNKNHNLSNCSSFVKMSPVERFNFTKSHFLCLRCLSNKHFISTCSSSNKCGVCQSLDHCSLLHLGKVLAQNPKPVPNPSLTPKTSTTVTTLASLNCSDHYETVLLSTAVCYVKGEFDRLHRLRLLIDTASQGTFISKACVERLGLSVIKTSIPLKGMSSTNLGSAKGKVNVTIEKPFDKNSPPLKIEALVVDYITKCPQINVSAKSWPHLFGLKLADPTWNFPSDIDILLGSEYIADVLLGNPIHGPNGAPSAIESIYGFCLTGKIPGKGVLNSFCTTFDLDESIKKMWTLEELPCRKVISLDDQICNKIYALSVSRLPTGRYVVKLPFRNPRPYLEESRDKALNRFRALERKLVTNANLSKEYTAFMQDYLAQGHMKLADPLPPKIENYFVPHHCIQNPKFKVVFDFSMTSNNGPSLNQVLYTGEKLHTDLINILLKFRLFSFVVVADIRQMYRNITIHESQWNYLRIFWRENPSLPLREYTLTTLPYGIASAPFLAIKTIQQLVEDEGGPFGLASKALVDSIYIDDVVASVATVSEGIQLRNELIELLSRGEFSLRKWNSNSQDILNGIPPEFWASSSNPFNFEDSDQSYKILGLVWHAKNDILSFSVNYPPQEITKRKVLSELGKLFDPLGLLSPVTLLGRLVLKSLWEAGVDWDETPSQNICSKWTKFRSELPLLQKLALPRSFHLKPNHEVQLHAFGDASESGYAAAVYIVVPMGETVNTFLLMAKSKVSPLNRVTIPRLELCALLLACKLLNFVSNLYKNFCNIVVKSVWSDSLVALHWAKSPPHIWKAFVANRVSQIQEFLSPSLLRFVPTALNPADVASRGVFPLDILENPLWWAGPSFLKLPMDKWPKSPPSLLSKDLPPEESKNLLVFSLNVPNGNLNIVERFSSLSRLKRVVALCLRFVGNCRLKLSKKSLLVGPLTSVELRNSLYSCVKLVQSAAFAETICLLQAGKLPPRNWRMLNPFVDNDNILRVGGRLSNACLNFDRTHPIILPKSHHFTFLIIDYFHSLYFHPGPSTLLSIIRNQFWIIAGRSVIRNRLLKCIQCFRQNPKSLQPLLGNLPSCRLQQVRAFSICGVDFAGPFDIRASKLRNSKICKAYLCLFICFSTKAIHLELASDLSTETFIAAFRRFIARRGMVKEIYSDNGRNFVGAKRLLDSWFQLVSSPKFQKDMESWSGEMGIKWSTIPSYAPHMGGIWESNIKSVKRLLAHTLGSQILTFEEFYTLLTQVESILNSRPITPLSSDPNDLEVLTPAHFLLQEPVGTFVEPNVENINSLHRRWKLIQQVVATFWRRWQSEYLSQLQLRYKWNSPSPNIEVGSLVLIKDSALPPLKWKLGRVSRVIPGSDGIVRVAEVKSASGLIVRPVVKICPLPWVD